MRQRTTFFLRPGGPVDPNLLQLSDTSLTGPAVDAAREDRVTLGLDELPASLARLLSSAIQELHIHWAAPTVGSPLVSPLLSRISPGLHVWVTPRPDAAEHERGNVCSLLRTMFGPDIDCQSTSASFNRLHEDREARADAYQFYAALDDLSGFAAHIRADWCPTPDGHDDSHCALHAGRLNGARALHLSYDMLSRTAKVTTQWPLARQALSVTVRLRGARTEVGIMAADAPPTLGPHEIGMAGFVAVLGQDDAVKPVMFAFPSRHREAAGGASFSATFTQPTGLHPTLQLRVAPGPPPRDDGTCGLYTYLTLPRHIFADKYQLADALFLASKNLTALHHITQPVDLEAPDYAVPIWGSAALVELAPPRPDPSAAAWTADIPLHLRYLLPADGGYRLAQVPYPVVFWACAADDDTLFGNNPFDRTHLGYDTLFDATTEFWHVKPDRRLGGIPPDTAAADSLSMAIRVPVLDASQSQWVNTGTSAAILVGFSWVLWRLISVYLRTDYRRVPPSETTRVKKTQ